MQATGADKAKRESPYTWQPDKSGSSDRGIGWALVCILGGHWQGIGGHWRALVTNSIVIGGHWSQIRKHKSSCDFIEIPRACHEKWRIVNVHVAEGDGKYKQNLSSWNRQHT